jgi:hypothetical protein
MREKILTVLNPDFTKEAIVDTYDSLIWSERYNESGDFELQVTQVTKALSLFTYGRILALADHKVHMFIEDTDLTTNINKGDTLVIKGRSLESVLARRVILEYTNIEGSLEEGIKQLIDDAIIAPTNVDRTIPNFVFVYSGDAEIEALLIDQQFLGESLYEAISTICQTNFIGFQVLYNSDTGNIEFSLYKGTDRTRDQLVNPFVEFSPDFNNLINSNYYEQNKHTKNYAVVGGEGEGSDRYMIETSDGGVHTGFARREVFVDATHLSRNTNTGLMPEAEYEAKLAERGVELLTKYKPITVFDGAIEQISVYSYGTDYFMGDKVQFKNRYGISAKVRITEVITVRDGKGLSTYPSFRDFEV